MSSPLDQLLESKEQSLLARGSDCCRVADGAPWHGVFIDALAGRLLVSLRDVELPADLRGFLQNCGRDVYVKHLAKGEKTAPEPLFPPTQPSRFTVRENGQVTLIMDMQAGYSQGLFIDQRDNRAEVMRRIRPGSTFLNLFAYTGAFSVYAALAGATTTTLDLAQPCLNWCRENMAANGLDPSQHFFCKGDALHWLSRFSKQGRSFDAIVLDPPTFSRDDRGRIWRAERDYADLVAKAVACLSPGGWMLCTTNCRQLTPTHFRAMVARGAPGARLTDAPMPFDFDGEPYLKTLFVDT